LFACYFCHTCRTVEEVPDYQGPHQYDHYLEHRRAPHQFESGSPHRGVLARVENKPEYIDAAIKEMENAVAPGSGSGLGAPLYELRETYKEGAFECWKRHNRTLDCGDYRSDKMRLFADTRVERKAEGMSTNKDDRANIWLCDHCPVHSHVVQLQRKQAGMYDK
jgi:hypothetical protein